MTGNSSSDAKEEPPDENSPNQRINRRQVAYSLAAFTAALVVAAFGFIFTYQSIADNGSSHIHAAESETLSQEDGAKEMTSPDEMQEGLAYDDDAGHAPHEDASHEDHGHNNNE